MNNFVVSGICIFALLVGLLVIIENDLYEQKQNRKMTAIALILILEIIIDTINLSIDGHIKDIYIYKISKALEFMITPLIPTVMASLVARKRYWKKIRKVFLVLILINIICQILTIFEPFIFAINERGIYVRTTLSFIYLVIVVICFVLLMICSYKTFIQNTLGVSCTMILTNILILIGVLIRQSNINANADFLCITIGYFLFLLDFANSFLKIDQQTSLLNRRAFDNKLFTIKYTTAIIIIDCNNFKKINDTYGHTCGDWTLAKIAELIFSIYHDIGFCYRIGGDEFCVILRPHMLKKLTYETENIDSYQMLSSLMKRLDDAIKELSKDHRKLQYGVSQGYGIYYSISDSPDIKQYMSIEQVFKLADDRMYEAKERSKKIVR